MISAAAATGALALVAGCTAFPPTGPDRDADGAVTAEGRTDAFSIEVGDCIDDPGTEKTSDITVLPCGEPHVFEAFARTEMPGGDYPGVPAASTAAGDFCAEEFAAYVGLEYDASVLELLYFYPVEESWNAADDREILCFVGDQGEESVTGTLRNARR
ncbi:septum formation family protein [Arthrobacter sp. MDT2-16]